MNSNPRISIILPTFNEAGNIALLIEKILAFVSDPLEILVVDDDSPDKTWETAIKLQKKYPVVVLRRTKNKGLSPAVIDGFKIAKGKIIGVIDADLSHPPERLPLMISYINKGYDVVIGSRLVKGGKVEEWPAHRKLISWGARLLARPLTPVRDIMSGYIILRKDVLKRGKLKAKGYKIALDILVRCKVKKVKEVPILFRNRSVGESKLSSKVYVHYVEHLAQLYGFKIRRIFK